MQENPKIEVREFNEIEYIHFTFKGKLTETNAAKAIDKWRNQIESKKVKFPHIWNCMEMTGYEPMARVLWQKAIKEFKGKISKIWLISDSNLIITGARILSVFTSFDICCVKSEDYIADDNLIISELKY